MALGVVGQKRGMTRIFTEDGVSVPVSVIEILPNKVTQVKTKETDGYPAVQVTTGTRRRLRVKKSLAGIFAKANVEAGRGLWEFRLGDSEAASRTLGSEITVKMFQPGQKVHVSGTTIGKDLRAPSNAIISARAMPRTGIRWRIGCQVLSGNVRHRVAYLKASACLGIWVMCAGRFAIWRSFAWMPSASCCW